MKWAIIKAKFQCWNFVGMEEKLYLISPAAVASSLLVQWSLWTIKTWCWSEWCQEPRPLCQRGAKAAGGISKHNFSSLSLWPKDKLTLTAWGRTIARFNKFLIELRIKPILGMLFTCECLPCLDIYRWKAAVKAANVLKWCIKAFLILFLQMSRWNHF